MITRLYNFVNKHSKWFVGAAVMALFSVVGIPMIQHIYDNRQEFEWNNYNEDLGNKDSEGPFGAKLYTEHLNEMWQGRVECDSDLVNALEKHKGQKCNYIVFANDKSYNDDVEPDTVDYYKTLIDAIGSGNNIVFCNPNVLVDDAMLQKARNNRVFDINDFVKYHRTQKLAMHYIDARTDRLIDSAMVWNNMLFYYYDLGVSDSIFADDIFSYYEPYGYGSTGGILVSPNRHFYVLARHFGKGCALLSGAPMLFSNYVLSVPDVQRVSDELLHYTFDEKLPLVIIYPEKYENKEEEDDDTGHGIFEVMFSNPATKVAMYLLVIMLLLVVVFNGRRRRNIVNEVKQEENSSLSYVRHLATLYSAKSDYKDLLIIEQRKILYILRNDYRFDIRTKAFTLPSEYSAFVANSKGGNEVDIHNTLTTLESLTSSHENVSRNDYMACIKLVSEALYSSDNK